MDKEFIPYEEALALKELGFDGECYSYYKWNSVFSNDVSNGRKYNSEFAKSGGYISAPLYQQAFRWFREKYELWFRPDYYDETRTDYSGSIHKLGKYSAVTDVEDYNTAEEAELACLRKLIEIVKEQQK